MKKEEYSKKQIIKKKDNTKINGFFINENILIIYYKFGYEIIFEENNMIENCNDINIKKYKHILFNRNVFVDIIKLNKKFFLIDDNYYIYFCNYELKQIETVIELESNSQFLFSRINANLIFVKNNIININQLNIKTFEIEKIKEIHFPIVFKTKKVGNNCIYSHNKLIYSISCTIYDELNGNEKNIAKLFIEE